MIKIKSISIKNFRSIISTELNFDLSNYTVLVGENNSGKSNILRALNLFFNENDIEIKYNSSLDFPKNLSASSKTQIEVLLSYNPEKETTIKRAIEEIENNTKQIRLDDNEIRLKLSYSKKGNKTWAFIGKKGSLNIPTVLKEKFVVAVRKSIRFKYIPVGRDILSLINKEFSEELIQILFGGFSGAVEYRTNIKNAIDTLINSLKPKLDERSKEITSSMKNVFSEINNFGLNLPFNSLETMLQKLKINVTDHYLTDLNSKGSGIQTSSLLFLMKFIADNYPQRNNAKVTYIWAIEEPESYLHPTKQREMAKTIKDFSETVQTIITTHNGHFISRNNGGVFVLEKKKTKPFQTQIISNQWEEAKRVLGVSILDSLRLWPINIIVEGPILRKFSANIYSSKFKICLK